jgi:hypothetical protein
MRLSSGATSALSVEVALVEQSQPGQVALTPSPLVALQVRREGGHAQRVTGVAP